MLKKKSKKPTVTVLKKKLDTIFSKYIRLKDANALGFVDCYTCGITKQWQKDGMQAGHFMSRKHTITRYDERNVKPQCYTCNCHYYGRQYEFGLALNKEAFDRNTNLVTNSMATYGSYKAKM